MSEVEFERLIDAVRNAVVLVPIEDLPMEYSLLGLRISEERPKAANDNFGHVWPMIPFPEGWHFA